MSSVRDFDVLVFGATGFAGKYATEYLLESALTPRWAIAGRSRTKLDALLAQLRGKHPSAAHAPTVLVADALGPAEALQTIFERTRVVINCAGPYSRMGAPVVAAAVAAGAHYVDIAGEPNHILGTMDSLHDRAAESGLLVVPACGFDHIPTDIGGYSIMSRVLREKAAEKGVKDPKMGIEMVAQFLEGPAGYSINTGTLDSIFEIIFRPREVQRLQSKLADRVPGPPVIPYDGQFGFGIGREPRLGPESPVLLANNGEAEAMGRTLTLVDAGLGTKGMPGSDTVAFRAYWNLWTWIAVLKVICGFIVCLFVAILPGGRRLVVNNASLFTMGVFSEKGPTEEQVQNSSVELTYFGRAQSSDGKDVAHAVVKGRCPEPAYDATSRMAIASAFTILEERENCQRAAFSRLVWRFILQTFNLG